MRLVTRLWRYTPAIAIAVGLAACAPPAPTEPTVAPDAAAPTEQGAQAIAEATTAPMAEPTAEAPTDPTEAAAHAVHWGYEGEVGPEYWSELNPDYAACSAGTKQSPIDLDGLAEEDLANIVFYYQASGVNIQNNGHTVQVNYDPGSFIELDGQRYVLDQFHFHAPSEHTVAGEPASAELHFVHKNDQGQVAVVVGVLIQTGAENPAFATVWANLPAEEGEIHTVDAKTSAADMLPAVQTTYRYDGSLTTPPCKEGVAWNVMTTPIEMSEAQLAAFTAIFEGNNRPVQPRGDRELVEDVSP